MKDLTKTQRKTLEALRDGPRSSLKLGRPSLARLEFMGLIEQTKRHARLSLAGCVELGINPQAARKDEMWAECVAMDNVEAPKAFQDRRK